MTRPGKIPSQAGFEPRIFRFRGGRLYYQASEAVGVGDGVWGGGGAETETETETDKQRTGQEDLITLDARGLEHPY